LLRGRFFDPHLCTILKAEAAGCNDVLTGSYSAEDLHLGSLMDSDFYFLLMDDRMFVNHKDGRFALRARKKSY
jgi:hypothetical protein